MDKMRMDAVTLAEELEAYLCNTAAGDYDAKVTDGYLKELDRRVPLPPRRSRAQGWSRLKAQVRTLDTAEDSAAVAADRAPARWPRLAVSGAMALLLAVLLVWVIPIIHTARQSNIAQPVPAPAASVIDYEALRGSMSSAGYDPELAPGWLPDGLVVAYSGVNRKRGCFHFRFTHSTERLWIEYIPHEKNTLLDVTLSDKIVLEYCIDSHGQTIAIARSGTTIAYGYLGQDDQARTITVTRSRQTGITTAVCIDRLSGIDIIIEGNISPDEIRRVAESMGQPGDAGLH